MKTHVMIVAALFVVQSSSAFAGTAQVICADEFLADNNTFGGLGHALKKLNDKLKKLPSQSVSAPVFVSSATPVIVCVTVNQ